MSIPKEIKLKDGNYMELVSTEPDKRISFVLDDGTVFHSYTGLMYIYTPKALDKLCLGHTNKLKWEVE